MNAIFSCSIKSNCFARCLVLASRLSRAFNLPCIISTASGIVRANDLKPSAQIIDPEKRDNRSYKVLFEIA
ncbi:MAG: hypothetical protein ABJN36_17565 [Cyclobacteriaceae bacterium]